MDQIVNIYIIEHIHHGHKYNIITSFIKSNNTASANKAFIDNCILFESIDAVSHYYNYDILIFSILMLNKMILKSKKHDDHHQFKKVLVCDGKFSNSLISYTEKVLFIYDPFDC